MNDDRAQTGGIDLTAEQVLTYPVHADAMKLVGHRSQGADNFEFACNARFMQRPCAVFTARPCNKSFGRSRHGIQSIAGRVPAGIVRQTLWLTVGNTDSLARQLAR